MINYFKPFFDGKLVLTNYELGSTNHPLPDFHFLPIFSTFFQFWRKLPAFPRFSKFAICTQPRIHITFAICIYISHLHSIYNLHLHLHFTTKKPTVFQLSAFQIYSSNSNADCSGNNSNANNFIKLFKIFEIRCWEH